MTAKIDTFTVNLKVEVNIMTPYCDRRHLGLLKVPKEKRYDLLIARRGG